MLAVSAMKKPICAFHLGSDFAVYLVICLVQYL